jgi:hypothetical protein
MCNYPVSWKQSLFSFRPLDQAENLHGVRKIDMLSYLGLKFQINRSSERHRNTGQQRLYKFCYLLHFDLWTSYLPQKTKNETGIIVSRVASESIRNMNETENSNKNINKICKTRKQHPNMLDMLKLYCKK